MTLANLRDDVQLTRQHVQSISSADWLHEFFTILGYPADARLEMTAESLQLSTALTDVTRHIERVTSVEGALQVYLFELTSVTVARTRALARVFRNRMGNFLLVLTDDYRQIDFVLLVREAPGFEGMGVTTHSVLIRPRTLSVDRRDPGRVALRVLRRFTLTEYDAEGYVDPYAQFDKLSSAFTVAEWAGPLFNNRALFSDYYLNQRLPELKEWHAPERNQAFRQVRSAFAQARRRFAGQPAAVVRQELIQPLLEALNFNIEAGPGGTEPNFLLHTDDGDAPAAFVLVYHWNRYLDGKDQQDDERPEENPGAQVVSLLEKGAAPWGIVTNGKVWRLYAARAHSRATNYYEIDLEETLASPDPGEPFRYFYLLFRAAAFLPASDPKGFQKPLGSTFLDWLMEESAAYARELGERLKERIFEQIFPHFAEGFIAGLGGPEALLALPEAEREAQLEAVFHGTLTFLYRLLFLLYAESRDLLPVREVRGYYQVSLQKLKEEIAAQAGKIEDHVPDKLALAYDDHLSSPSGGALYGRLLTLFEIVDRGSKARNVPIYNGGLFLTDVPGTPGDAESLEMRAARFLLDTAMPDQHLALGLDRLARDVDPQRGDLGFIDYKSLGVRQLGSIYEGLLEFKVRVAPERMAVVEGKRAEEVIPYAEAKRQKMKILTQGRGQNAAERTLARGTVYLENDRRERKATGSYYTPDYIVKYIVRHTVGPVLDEKLDDLRPRLHEADVHFRAVVQRKREVEGVTPDEPAILQLIAGDVLRDLFDVKVLDPAMGSGHFLVEGVDYVTDRLVRFLDGFPFLATFFEGMRGSILAEMERQEVTVDPARLTDVTLLKRHVLKRCIYGVDLNPMAVELAKVSLWLDCFTLGAPLSFLDHHLRCGNSLIGAMAREVEAEMGGGTSAGQMTFLTGPFTGLLRAADIMRGISGIADVTLEQVRESRHLFDDFDRAAKPYKQLLDVHVAQHFGVERAAEFLEVHTHDPNQALKIVQADPQDINVAHRETIRQTRELYEEKRFFHWDLEFPEVFIDLEHAAWKADGGFDAVIGNPPYDEISEYAWGRSVKEIDYFTSQSRFDGGLGGRQNLFRFFILQAIELLRPSGMHSFIVPMPLLSDKFSEGVRRYLLSSYQICSISNFPQKDDPQNRVFKEAKLSTCIYVLKKDSPVDSFKVYTYPGKEFSDGVSFTGTADQIRLIDPENWAIPSLDQTSWSLLTRLASNPGITPFSTAATTYPGEVMLNKQYERFISDMPPGELLLRGAHIGRYEFNDDPKQGSPKYLDVETYLDEKREGTKAYHHRFSRIGFQRGSAIDNWRRLIGTFLETGCFLTDTVGYILPEAPYDLFFLLALFNCQLFEWRFGLTSSTNHVNAYEVDSLPLRLIHFTTPEAEREQRVAGLVARHERGEHAALLAEVEELLPQNADGEFLAFQPGATGAEEHSDVIHDLLAHLAEEMIAMHKEKQARVEAFWEDLKAATDPATFDTLRNKGKWEQSLAKDPTCVPYVDAESRSTRGLDESLGWNEACYEAFAGMLVGRTSVTPAMMGAYRAHHAGYKSLVARIEATDRLIDQVVYRLYGLTEDEVAVVEGTEYL